MCILMYCFCLLLHLGMTVGCFDLELLLQQIFAVVGYIWMVAPCEHLDVCIVEEWVTLCFADGLLYGTTS